MATSAQCGARVGVLHLLRSTSTSDGPKKDRKERLWELLNVDRVKCLTVKWDWPHHMVNELQTNIMFSGCGMVTKDLSYISSLQRLALKNISVLH